MGLTLASRRRLAVVHSHRRNLRRERLGRVNEPEPAVVVVTELRHELRDAHVPKRLHVSHEVDHHPVHEGVEGAILRNDCASRSTRRRRLHVLVRGQHRGAVTAANVNAAHATVPKRRHIVTTPRAETA